MWSKLLIILLFVSLCAEAQRINLTGTNINIIVSGYNDSLNLISYTVSIPVKDTISWPVNGCVLSYGFYFCSGQVKGVEPPVICPDMPTIYRGMAHDDAISWLNQLLYSANLLDLNLNKWKLINE